MSGLYYRPLLTIDRSRGTDAVRLAGGWAWFDTVEVLERDRPAHLVPVSEVPDDVLTRLTAPRAPIAGLTMDAPRLMGIVNVTPDSFSDGGLHATTESAVARALELAGQGADIVDLGGESTRPGADHVSPREEITRVVPVIEGVAARAPRLPLSIDTRKAGVAKAAFRAGAGLFNDVSALSHDLESLSVAAGNGWPVCLMHASGDPATMQDDPRYDNVLLDVYDYLDARVQACVAAGLPRYRILVDPGIGFGKTLDHNLALLRGIALFHGLGCGILLGVSRKRFIGTIGDAPEARDRAPGSVAVGLAALAQGVQILRVHDMAETKQAVRLWQALI